MSMQTFAQFLRERRWSTAYKRSINCERPKGFSQRAHCAGRKTRLKEATRVPLSVPGVSTPLTVVIDVDVLDQHPIYRVFAGTEKVGYAKLSGDGRSVMDVVIAPAWQRQGIASALYDVIEQDRGLTLRPSPMSQSDAGKAFWRKRQS